MDVNDFKFIWLKAFIGLSSASSHGKNVMCLCMTPWVVTLASPSYAIDYLGIWISPYAASIFFTPLWSWIKNHSVSLRYGCGDKVLFWLSQQLAFSWHFAHCTINKRLCNPPVKPVSTWFQCRSCLTTFRISSREKLEHAACPMRRKEHVI